MKLQHWVVPMMYYDGARMSSFVKLRINDDVCDENMHKMHEDYAKLALLMFFPFRKLEDIKLEGSYWKLFHCELTLLNKNESTTFWTKGYEILQKIKNHQALQLDIPKQIDEVMKHTHNKLETQGNVLNKNKPPNNIPDIGEMDV